MFFFQSFGNHEFDNGIEGLLPMIDNITFPVVAANLDYTNEPKMAIRKIPKSFILNHDGYRIGVIGYVTPETAIISTPNNITFLDEIPSIKAESERLSNNGVKMIIALGHSGFEMDKKIAKEVPEVDIVVGGHTNTFLWNGDPPDSEKPEGLYPTIVTQKSGKKVPVVQAYAYTKYMGRLHVTFDEGGNLIKFQGDPLLLDTYIPQEKDLLNLLEEYRPQVLDLDKNVVGKTRVFLDGRPEACRITECNLGNLITDAFIEYKMSLYPGVYWTDTPIGIMNGGAIRNNINSTSIGGTVTRGDVLAVMPFENQIVSLNLNGSNLRQTLETGVRSNGETSKGEFLQVSGLIVTYNMSMPPGKRVVDVKVRCSECEIPRYEPLIPHKIYRIVTTSFLTNGGDGHKLLQNAAFNKKTEDLNDLEMVIWYFKRHQLVYPEVRDRIILLKKEEGSNSSGSRMQNHFLSILLSYIFFKFFVY